MPSEMRIQIVAGLAFHCKPSTLKLTPSSVSVPMKIVSDKGRTAIVYSVREGWV